MTPSARRQALRAAAAAMLAAVLAWTLGGQSLLGRIDPVLAIPLLMLPMLLLAWWQRALDAPERLLGAAQALVLLALLQLLAAAVLAARFAGMQAMLTVLAGGVAALAADRIVHPRALARWFRLVLVVVATIGWFVGAHIVLSALYRPAAALADAPAITMLTGLPLRWAGGDVKAMVASGARDDPALVRLAASGPLALVDSLADNVPPPGGAVLLAHPRALPPHELVALDAFVRGGGHAVILADALSGWPSAHPLGDPRNPPATSLLTPLLDHWGLRLAGAPVGQRDALAFDVEGARLRLFSAGRFDKMPPGCRAFAGARVLWCPIGAGEVWLVGDADLLFAPLWRPPISGAAHLRRADTMEWLLARLGRGDSAAGLRLEPVWIRAPAD